MFDDSTNTNSFRIVHAPIETRKYRKPSTLKDDEIQQILLLISDKDCKRMTTKQIAEAYNLSPSAICRIAKGEIKPTGAAFNPDDLRTYNFRKGWERIAYVIDILTRKEYQVLTYTDISSLVGMNPGAISYIQSRLIWLDLWECFDSFVKEGIRSKWPSNKHLLAKADKIVQQKRLQARKKLKVFQAKSKKSA